MLDSRLSTDEFDPKLKFCAFRIPKSGKRAIWEITNTCNYSCVYCIFSSLHGLIEGELSTQEAISVINQLSQNGFTHLKITGGEPFIRPDLIKIVERGLLAGIEIDISTNASLITQQKAEQLKDIGVKMVHVGFDGHTKILQEKVRGERSFDLSIRGIRNLVNARVYTRLGMVIYKANQAKLEEMVHFCIKLGVNEVIFSLMEPVGRMRGKTALLSSRSITELKQEIATLQQRYETSLNIRYSFASSTPTGVCSICPGGSRFLYIDNLGRVSPYTWISEYLPKYLSKKTLKNYSLAQLIKSDTPANYQTKSRKLFAAGIKGCPAKQPKLLIETDGIDALFVGKKFEQKLSLGGRFSEFSQLYSFTTECLSNYFHKIPFANNHILTIGGSGDHALNSVHNGATLVTAVDVNMLAKLYFDLKLTAINQLSLNEFKQFFFRASKNSKPLDHKVYLRISQHLQPLTKYFFNNVYAYYDFDGNKIRESDLYNNKYDVSDEKIANNSYLRSTADFELLKQKLKTSTINWVTADITQFVHTLLVEKQQFDTIFLSNISDYTSLLFRDTTSLQTYVESLIQPMSTLLRAGGCIQAAYVYDTDLSAHGTIRSEIDDQLKRKIAFDLLSDLSVEELSFETYKGRKDLVVLLTKELKADEIL